jgi:hypothetical protein
MKSAHSESNKVDRRFLMLVLLALIGASVVSGFNAVLLATTTGF